MMFTKLCQTNNKKCSGINQSDTRVTLSYGTNFMSSKIFTLRITYEHTILTGETAFGETWDIWLFITLLIFI